MTFTRSTLLVLALSFLGAAPALAQPIPGGGLIGGIDEDANSGEVRITGANRREIRTVKRLTRDGELSAEDLKEVLASTGGKASPAELEIVRLALAGEVPTGPEFDVSDEAKEAAVDLLYTLNLFEDSIEALKDGKTYGGTELPRSVKEVVATARLNGATAYDVTETDEDGEGIYSHYPATTPATENMAFDWTEITPASLLADMNDTSEHLRIRGTRSVSLGGDSFTVGNYVVGSGGTGSISATYDEAFHPVRKFAPVLLEELGYPADLDVDRVRKARSSSGNKWSSNCAILSDGSIHCLPAVRRHSANTGLILTNPSLSRGHQLLWNGHLRVTAGKVTYIGTSGGIAKRAARGKDIFINPIPLLKAWGFEMTDGLQVTSEHRSARPSLSEERAIMFESPQE